MLRGTVEVLICPTWGKVIRWTGDCGGDDNAAYVHEDEQEQGCQTVREEGSVSCRRSVQGETYERTVAEPIHSSPRMLDSMVE